jgi:hypothetical protein
MFSPDYGYQGAWIIMPNNSTAIDYWSQSPSRFVNIDHIMAEH